MPRAIERIVLLFDGEDDDAVAAARARWSEAKAQGLRGRPIGSRTSRAAGSRRPERSSCALDGCGRQDGDAKLVLCPPQGGGIRGLAVRVAARMSMLLASGAGARRLRRRCRTRIRSGRPTAANLFRPTSVTNYKDKVLPPVAAEDLVDASGRCAGALCRGSQRRPAGGQANVPLQEAGVPLIPAAIALEMSECDVVKRAGVAEKVEIGTNERSERTATLTYISGQRPGIYSLRRPADLDGARARAAGAAEAREEAGETRQARGPAECDFGSVRPAGASGATQSSRVELSQSAAGRSGVDGKILSRFWRMLAAAYRDCSLSGSHETLPS